MFSSTENTDQAQNGKGQHRMVRASSEAERKFPRKVLV